MNLDTIFSEDESGIRLSVDKPLTIQVGRARITLTPSGDITLKGTSITVEGSTLKMASQSQTDISTSGALSIKGALLKLN